EDFRAAVAGIKMDGPCAKVNLVLGEEPRVAGMPPDAGPGQRALFTLPPDLAVADACYDRAKRGELADPGQLFIDCVVASNVDPSLAPAGRHIMTCFAQYVPYRLAGGTWDSRRDDLGDRVVTRIGAFAPNVPGAVLARQVLTPLDLERTYRLTEGNIFHGDLQLDQLFHMRPVPGWARYATPVRALYLCGAGAHRGTGVQRGPPGAGRPEAEPGPGRAERGPGRKRTEHTVNPDVIIVGAGVAGASAAFHLSRLGAGDVLVLDRGTAGSGMSSRSSALVRMHYTFQGEVELAVRSDRMFAEWPELTGRPPVVRRTGFARIVLPGEEQALAANVAMQRSCGAAAEVI